jgi:hypothetical protein
MRDAKGSLQAWAILKWNDYSVKLTFCPPNYPFNEKFIFADFGKFGCVVPPKQCFT